MNDCKIDSFLLGAKYYVEIIGSNCMDIIDSQGTLLGEYLYINCQSGDCNRFKSEIKELRLQNGY